MVATGNMALKWGLKFILIPILGGLWAETAEGREPRSFRYQGEAYVSLSHLASFYGLGRVVEEGDDFVLESGRGGLRFTRESRKLEVNGIRVWMHAPVVQARRRWAVRNEDVLTVIDPLLRTDRHLAERGHRLVVLDPGHGGEDRGTHGPSGLQEKELTLDVARRVRSLLVNAGVQVLMTREFDRAVSLPERVRLTGEWNADLFVSIHFNSAQNAQAHGTETFLLTGGGFASTASNEPGDEIPDYPGNRFNGANAILGYYVQGRLLQHTSNFDRGVRRARFAVLRDAPCPAVLVECAFLSHAPEEARLAADAYREAIARGIAEGILDYIGAVRRAQVNAR